MQAFSSTVSWTPPTGTLGELTAAAHERAASLVNRIAELRAAAGDVAPSMPFAEILRAATVSVIAEVKRASPSKGEIAPHLDAVAQAQAYVLGGAAAISVLTEPVRFGGSLTDLRDVTRHVAVPVIRKDFLVHPVQLWEARAAGASVALLIVRALSPDLLRELMATIAEAGLEALVEIRDEGELERALSVDARVIGINNRNLETLVIDANTAPRIIPYIPPRCIAVAASGMREPADVTASAIAGADAILVGSAISASSDPAAAVRALSSIRRHER